MTNKIIQQYLKRYSNDTHLINRLLVSCFIEYHHFQVISNPFLQGYLIDDKHEELECKVEFLNILTVSKVNFTIEYLLSLFEHVISPIDKIVTGAIYTPLYIRTFITDHAFSCLPDKSLSNCLVVDLSCGSGGFLINAVQRLRLVTKKSITFIIENNIYGLDVMAYSVERTKIILSLLALLDGEDNEINFNIFTGNALDYDWYANRKIKQHGGFDIVLGNPPYVCSKNIDSSSRKLLAKWDVTASGHPDLYIPFFQIAYTYLCKSGIMGYIVLNTFFKSFNARALRAFFKDNYIELKIIDFQGEQIFKSKTTYTCVCFLRRSSCSYIRYTPLRSKELNQKKIKYDKILYSELDSISGWNLQTKKTIDRIESIGVPLIKSFKALTGIATLKNDVFIFKPKSEDHAYYYIQDDIPIEKELCRNIINSNMLVKKPFSVSMIQKIIFPYFYHDSEVKIMEEGLIKEKFPHAYSFLESKKVLLASRDKGKGNYPRWYAFGRSQSLSKYKYKLLFPHISNRIPSFHISNDPDLYFVNGMAIVSDSLKELEILKRVLQSNVFWYYIQKTSRHYNSGYYSFSRTYIKSFGIPVLSAQQKNELLSMNDQNEINTYVESLYKINFDFPSGDL
ncbi:Type IIS restriction enzyme Eco57I [uncultured bacterium]|nr:Type IIS restriction enzyme Eco57I [uncultured bacterium]